MYKKIILPILFLIDPEKVHNIIFSSIKILFKFPFVKLLVSKFYIIDDSRLEKSLQKGCWIGADWSVGSLTFGV